MVEQDTVRLLRECDAGVAMGISSINDVIGRARATDLRSSLHESKEKHEQIKSEIRDMLNGYSDAGKKPNPVAKTMSHAKTMIMLGVNSSDHTIADLITDGCNMGVKSLSKYLNKYGAASERSKDIAKKLIAMEDTLAKDIRGFL